MHSFYFNRIGLKLEFNKNSHTLLYSCRESAGEVNGSYLSNPDISSIDDVVDINSHLALQFLYQNFYNPISTAIPLLYLPDSKKTNIFYIRKEDEKVNDSAVPILLLKHGSHIRLYVGSWKNSMGLGIVFGRSNPLKFSAAWNGLRDAIETVVKDTVPVVEELIRRFELFISTTFSEDRKINDSQSDVVDSILCANMFLYLGTKNYFVEDISYKNFLDKFDLNDHTDIEEGLRRIKEYITCKNTTRIYSGFHMFSGECSLFPLKNSTKLYIDNTDRENLENTKVSYRGICNRYDTINILKLEYNVNNGLLRHVFDRQLGQSIYKQSFFDTNEDCDWSSFLVVK